MKLTKKLETEILKVYNSYWDSYFKGDMRAFASLLHENVQLIGSSENEVFSNKRSAMKFYKATAGQVAGKAGIQNRKIAIRLVGSNVLVIEQSDFYVLIDNEWNFYGHGRISTLLQQTDKGWKIIHEHGSLPDSKAGEGEQVNTERIKAENQQLREAVKRRTVELEQKNRELEIETALEKVRSTALAMNEPGDMLDVCKTIALQLELLGVKEIRNVQTAIFYELRGTYMNYEYYAKHKKTFITETSYTNHKIHKAFALKMLKGKGEFFVTHIKGKKVKEWIAYQKTTNVFIDKYLNTASSLNYYWHSLGPVALGISTYHPLAKEESNLFTRFLKVFELAYRRYLDIENAKAQAREAKIETSLEKIRAAAMSMQKPDELLNICETLFKELQLLGFAEIRNSMINIHNDENKTFLNYDYSDEIGKSVTLFDYNAHPVMEKQIQQLRMADDAFSEAVYKEKDLEAWKEFRRNFGEKDDPRIENISALYYYFYSIGNGSIGISTFSSITEEKLALLKRFRNVFSLAYQRYSDIALAEAQAKEAQIEAALERVRAKSMAMHHTSELQEVVNTVAQQLLKMDMDINGGVFITINDDVDKDLWCWGSFGVADSYVQKTCVPFLDRPIFTVMIDAIKNRKGFVAEEYTKEEKIEFFNNLFKHPPFSSISQERKKEILSREGGYTRSIAVSNYTSIFMINHYGRKFSDADNEILKRLGKVFEQSYIRFLDLQKAEAQTREAQIEASLEKVRSSAMAMHKSNDISLTTTVIFEELKKLSIKSKRCGIGLLSKESKTAEVYAAATSSDGKFHTLMRTIDMTQHESLRHQYDSWIKQEYYETILKGEELRSYYKLPFFQSSANYVPTNHFKQSEYGYYIPFSKGLFYAWSENPYKENEINILNRFKSIIELTFRRFFDLQKAEAQAREAQIQLALERVRARTMAMQKSDELAETAQVLFQQFSELGENPDQLSIGIMHENEKVLEIWLSVRGIQLNQMFKVPIEERVVINKIYKAWKENKKSLVIDISGDELKTYNDFRNSLAEFKEYNDVKNSKSREEHRRVIYCAFFPKGLLSVATPEPRPEEILKLLERFAGVFDLTYTRFLDLQKAEAQAREAQIEAALERVRSRTMGMQKSEELKEVIQLVYEQFVHLNIHVEHTGFIIDYKARDDLHIWLADQHLVPSEVTIPCFDSPPNNSIKEAKEKGQDFFEYFLTFEEKNKFYRDLFKFVPDVSEESLEYYFNCPGLAGSGVLLDNIGLYIENFSGTPYTDEENNILMRFGKVFQQTYTRFLDLKNAEAQARESQIEAALEKIRSRSLAMQKSDELKEVITVVLQKLQELGMAMEVRVAGIYTFEEDSKDHVEWVASPQFTSALSVRVPYFNHPVIDEFLKIHKTRSTLNKAYSRELKDSAFRVMYQLPELRNNPESEKEWVFGAKDYSLTIAFEKYSAVGIASFPSKLFTDSEITILKRFSRVFEQSYIRFLDLKKAEAQAREAQIEAALERVRASSMAMHRSDELLEVISIVSNQLENLGFRFDIVSFAANNKEFDYNFWLTVKGQRRPYRIYVPYIDSPMFERVNKAQLEGQPFYTDILSKEENKQWHQHLFEHNKLDFVNDKLKKYLFNSGFARSIALLPKIMLIVGNYSSQPYTDEENNIIKRFANVFDQVYRRFLDLQKAEVQAREAQIEAALERVRARTMAMHNSNDVGNATAVMFTELEKLGIETIRCGIDIMDKSKIFEVWASASSDEDKVIQIVGKLDSRIHPHLQRVQEAWERQDKFISSVLEGQDLVDYYKKLSTAPDYRVPATRVQSNKQFNYDFFFKEGGLFAYRLKPFTEEEITILQRFTSVFGLTFRRYLDLKKAEAQTREAKIEASLERVRSKAMAMHSPNDLSETVNVFFKELRTLDIIPIRCGVGQIDEATRTTSLTTTTSSQQGDSFQVIGKIKQTGHPVLDGIFENWKLQKEYHPVLEGEDIKAYYNVMNPQIGYPEYPEGVTQYGNCFYFKEGFVFAWTEKKLSEEELQIFRRFTSVLSLTYRRYIDLKDAHARALEAVKQASLDRVRAEIASMRTAEDLNRITPIIWRELKTLNVPFIRCGVFIVDEIQERTQVYLTTPDGKSLGVLNLIFNSNELTNNAVANWKKKQVYKEHWNKEEFINWTKSMMELGQVQNAEIYQGSTTPPESLHLHFVPFTQGMLYVGDVSPLTDQKLDLVKTLAEAFSIAYARYEDFRNLEDAKNKIELTLKELKSAQVQLIHSEKMASLGELTAGIAHEIKNPLNFVNNFSEISNELLSEMKAELKNNNTDEVLSLIEDLKQNLDKINQHGKRADSIVKGMLLHSRGSSGEKTLTDINGLLDQYVNLAYHGMRAQNKDFNITIEKDYDESLEKINVVPQDISRVFLNIINNACYAANEKRKIAGNRFNPLLKVSTKNSGEKVEVHIRDNGNGIPNEVLEKIFQPFFTTKPTGEGTGLGLSLSYDIVSKVHGGELRVETKEGEGSVFIISIPKS